MVLWFESLINFSETLVEIISSILLFINVFIACQCCNWPLAKWRTCDSSCEFLRHFIITSQSCTYLNGNFIKASYWKSLPTGALLGLLRKTTCLTFSHVVATFSLLATKPVTSFPGCCQRINFGSFPRKSGLCKRIYSIRFSICMCFKTHHKGMFLNVSL